MTFRNPLDMPVEFTLAAVLGHDMPGQPMAHAAGGEGWSGIRIHDDEIAPDDPDHAGADRDDAAETSRQTCHYRGLWYDALEVYWKNSLARPPAGPVSKRATIAAA